MLDPHDIDSMKFKTTRLKEGYDQEEVDDFLDRVAAEYAELHAKWQRLEVEAARLQRVIDARGSDAVTAPVPLASSVSPAGSAEKLLVLAQETADKHVADAKAQAEEVVRQAGGKGARLVEEAQQAGEEIVRKAQERAETIINDGYAEKAKRHAELDTQHEQLTSALAQLEQRGRTVRNALNEALNSVGGAF